MKNASHLNNHGSDAFHSSRLKRCSRGIPSSKKVSWKLWTIIYRSIGNIQNIPYLLFLKESPTNSNLINFCQY